MNTFSKDCILHGFWIIIIFLNLENGPLFKFKLREFQEIKHEIKFHEM